MKQLTIKMLREIDELATKETMFYAKELADQMSQEHQSLVYYSIINGGNCALSTIIRYLLKLDEEEQQ